MSNLHELSKYKYDVSFPNTELLLRKMIFLPFISTVGSDFHIPPSQMGEVQGQRVQKPSPLDSLWGFPENHISIPKERNPVAG